MKTRATRCWIATYQYVGRTNVPRAVELWYWTRQKGLRVVYTDGLDVRSAYTLREFLAAVRKKHEGPVREVERGEVGLG